MADESKGVGQQPPVSEQLMSVPGYELEEEIGRGGMGVVYRARDPQFDRDVAIKLLAADVPADSFAVTRFRIEARITGQLQHPGIPAVHELGTLPDGKPFLAMKLVKGQTLQNLLEKRSNAQEDRGRFVAVFEQICQALGYAHAHQVLHRDLKPSNIMVGAFGEVQVMDWGLAKVLGDKASVEESAGDDLSTAAYMSSTIDTPEAGGSATRTGSVLGTPAYMPPEQAGGEIRKLDARSDVFGLGAILCQILTGQPPYVGKDSNDSRIKAVRGDLQDAFARLDTCGAEPDLITLCKKCLAFQKEERPAEANAVASAVSALRQAADDRAKQAELAQARAEVQVAEQQRRRRIWLGLAATLLVGLLAAVALGLWANNARSQAELAREAEAKAKSDAQVNEKLAKENEAKAKRNEDQAKEQAALATAVKNFLQTDLLRLAAPKLQSDNTNQVKMDPDLKVRDLVIRAAQQIEGKFQDQPKTEAEIRFSLGWTLHEIGRDDLAVPQYERAHALRTRILGAEHPDTLQSMNNLANSYAALGRQAEAHKLREETLALQKAKLGPEHPDTLTSMNNLASSYNVLGRHGVALQLREETLALQKAKLGPEHPETLKSMRNLANIYSVLGRQTEALKLREESLAGHKTKLGPEHPETLHSMNDLANSYYALGRHAEALNLNEETLALRKAKLGPEHPDTLSSMNNLAISYDALSRRADSLKLKEETLTLRKTKLGPEHPATLDSMHHLANSYDVLGRRSEALKLREETLALRKDKLGVDHPDTLSSMSNLAISYAALGRQAEALKLREETLALQKAKLGPEHPATLNSEWGVIGLLITLKRPKEAQPRIDALVEQADKATKNGKVIHSRLIPQMFAYRMQINQQTNNVAGCRDTAERWEKRTLKTDSQLYSAACYRAVTAALQAKAPGDGSAKLSTADADMAMQWLQKAIAAGYKDRAQMEKNTNLDCLRQREDFKKLIKSLPAPPKPAEKK